MEFESGLVNSIHHLAQFFADLEKGQPLRRDLYTAPCLRVSPLVRVVISYNKAPETPDFDPSSILQCICETFENEIDNIRGLLLREIFLLGQRLDQTRFIHGNPLK